MKLDSNNNEGIIYRIAKSNLMGKKLYTFFTLLSIVLSISFVSAMVFFLQGKQIAEKRMLGSMQHVMFMNISEEQMEKIEEDPQTEIMVPYKEGGEVFKAEGVKYRYNYLESQSEKIKTFVPVEGRAPEKYNEIVVDRRFMENIGQECKIGGKVLLQAGDTQEEFVICGFTDRPDAVSVSPVYVSREFAMESPLMKETGFTALVRILDAAQMESSGFETIVYQMAADYRVKRADVNINGRFEEFLQRGNTIVYAAVFISLFILTACGIVIYCIFYLSVSSRTRQIGQLQTIGMTQKQIKKMVRREGFLLSSTAIPLGIVLGGIIAYLLEPQGWSFQNNALAAVIIGIFGLIVVQISVGKPAELAAKVSPIEAAENLNRGDNSKEHAWKHKRLTAFVLAQAGQEGNHKKTSLMTVSLSFGGVVFMIAASYLYGWDEASFSREGEFENAEYILSYNYNSHNPSAYGPTEMQMRGQLSEELKEELLEIPHIRSVKAEEAAYGNIEYQGATWTEAFYKLTENSYEQFNMDVKGNNSYEYLCEHDGVIITNSEFIEEINGVSFKVGDKITLRWFDGEEHVSELEIAAVTPAEMDTSAGTMCMADKTMEKLWRGMNTACSFKISVTEYEKYGGQAEQEIRNAIEPYTDLALETLREKMINDAANIKKIKIQIYGITSFVILFSILNLVNMLIGNIVARKRELSMLESIGMEEKQIRNMMFWESIQFVVPALLITFVIGGIAGYGFVVFLQKTISYMDYRLPVIPGILYGVGVILMPVAISYISLKGMSKTSLVERIKHVD